MPGTDAGSGARPSAWWRGPIAFALGAALTIGCFLVQLSVARCHGGDAAGCGMSMGFAGMLVYALIALVAVASLIALLPFKATRVIAWTVLLGVGLVALWLLGTTIATNIRITGRFDGIDMSRPERQPDYPLRSAMRCFLAASVRRAEDREAARVFDEETAYSDGRLAQLGAFWEEDPKTLAIAREEGRKMRAQGEDGLDLGNCLSSNRDARHAWLEAAGYDWRDLERRRDKAYLVAPKPDPMLPSNSQAQD